MLGRIIKLCQYTINIYTHTGLVYIVEPSAHVLLIMCFSWSLYVDYESRTNYNGAPAQVPNIKFGHVQWQS